MKSDMLEISETLLLVKAEKESSNWRTISSSCTEMDLKATLLGDQLWFMPTKMILERVEMMNPSRLEMLEPDWPVVSLVCQEHSDRFAS